MGSGKHPLPAPLTRGVALLTIKRIGQRDPPIPACEVLLVQSPHLHEVGGEWLFDHRGQHGEMILVAFAFTHDNLIGGSSFDSRGQGCRIPHHIIAFRHGG